MKSAPGGRRNGYSTHEVARRLRTYAPASTLAAALEASPDRPLQTGELHALRDAHAPVNGRERMILDDYAARLNGASLFDLDPAVLQALVHPRRFGSATDGFDGDIETGQDESPCFDAFDALDDRDTTLASGARNTAGTGPVPMKQNAAGDWQWANSSYGRLHECRGELARYRAASAAAKPTAVELMGPQADFSTWETVRRAKSLDASIALAEFAAGGRTEASVATAALARWLLVDNEPPEEAGVLASGRQFFESARARVTANDRRHAKQSERRAAFRKARLDEIGRHVAALTPQEYCFLWSDLAKDGTARKVVFDGDWDLRLPSDETLARRDAIALDPFLASRFPDLAVFFRLEWPKYPGADASP